MLSLDMTKAFDCIKPSVVQEAITELALPDIKAPHVGTKGARIQSSSIASCNAKSMPERASSRAQRMPPYLEHSADTSFFASSVIALENN